MNRRPSSFRPLAVAATADSATSSAAMSYRPYVSATVHAHTHTQNENLDKQSITHAAAEVSRRISLFLCRFYIN